MCSDAAPSWELRGEGLSRLSSLGPFRGPGVGRSAEPACGLKEGCPVRGGGPALMGLPRGLSLWDKRLNKQSSWLLLKASVTGPQPGPGPGTARLSVPDEETVSTALRGAHSSSRSRHSSPGAQTRLVLMH